MSDDYKDESESVTKLLAEFSDHTIAELVLEISDLRGKLEAEKKSHAADEFGRKKAETEVEKLKEQINTAIISLKGETPIEDE